MTKVLVSVSNPLPYVAVVTLHRSEALNALNRDLLRALRAEVKTLDKESDLRAVIFTGEGEKAFSAGADLKERMGMSLEETREFIRLINETFNAIEGLPMPTIAAINGVALGGGFELALACDLRIASKEALLGLPECAWGIIPGAGGTQRLSRLVGIGMAKKLIFSTQKLTAETAYMLGLLEQMPAQKALEEALQLAQTISQNAPLSLRAAKTAISNSLDLSLDNGLSLESECYERVLYSHDRLEGLKAFQEKRVPLFNGT